MKIDLHNHTKHSDGVYTPRELVERAKNNNVDIFALTDHDSVFGDDEIELIAKEYGIRVVKGMELSTDYNGESVHVICLFKNNIVPKEMVEFSQNIIDKRRNRAIKMMENIRDIYGLKIDLDELLSATVITRGNMMRNIAKCNNLSPTEAGKYVQRDSKAYIPSTKMTVEEGIELARRNDCFVIFAHPCLIKNREWVDEIIKYGFDALEVRYPSPKNDIEYFTNLAKKYNLLISAGSDCHGDGNIDHGDIGHSTLNEEEFTPIAKKLGFEITW